MHNVLIEYYFNSGHYGVITNLTQPPFEMQRPAECTAPERPCSWGEMPGVCPREAVERCGIICCLCLSGCRNQMQQFSLLSF